MVGCENVDSSKTFAGNVSHFFSRKSKHYQLVAENKKHVYCFFFVLYREN